MVFLSRKFIILDDNNLDGYLNVLKNKIEKSEKNYGSEDIENLFKLIKKIKSEDFEEYLKIKEKFKEFTEDFIIKNAFYIQHILNMTEEQRKMIMVKFNYFNFTDSLNIIDLLALIIEKFKNIIYVYIDNVMKKNNNDMNVNREYALLLERRENKEFIGIIMDLFLKEYPMIQEYPIFGKLFMDLYVEINSIAYTYMVNKIEEYERKKAKEIDNHSGNMKEENLIRKIKREQCQSPKKLR